MGSLTFSAGVSVKDKLPFKNRFEDIHYCVVDYPVGKRNNAYHPLFGVKNFKLDIIA